MVYKELSVSVSRKISQNYNSTDHTCAVTVQLEQGDDPQSVELELRQWCKDRIRDGFKKPNEEETK
jgi:hypothetical protein